MEWLQPPTDFAAQPRPVWDCGCQPPSVSLLPQPLKPSRMGSCVADGVLKVPMPEVVLNSPGIRTEISEGESTGMMEPAPASRAIS
jgi:hypothetical protein